MLKSLLKHCACIAKKWLIVFTFSLCAFTEGGLGIPLVLVVVEGGVDSINDACKSLEHDIPVVVCSGTGRAADILAYAYKHTKTTAYVFLELTYRQTA